MAVFVFMTYPEFSSNVKKSMNQWIAKKWIGRSPFIGFKMSVNETHKTFLNEQELLLIAEKQIAIKRLEQVRDIFQLLHRIWLTVMLPNWRKQMLWSEASRIPLLPISNSIVTKYADHPVTSRSGKLLPVMSKQRMNSNAQGCSRSGIFGSLKFPKKPNIPDREHLIAFLHTLIVFSIAINLLQKIYNPYRDYNWSNGVSNQYQSYFSGRKRQMRTTALFWIHPLSILYRINRPIGSGCF